MPKVQGAVFSVCGGGSFVASRWRRRHCRGRIQAIVDQSTDRVAPRGHMDLIDEFAFRLPVIGICDLLGIPEEDHETFFQRERSGGRLLDPVPLTRAEFDAANRALLASTDYFQSLFKRRRRSPANDFTTQLLQAEEGGSQITSEELIASIILLFGAGHETTVSVPGTPSSRSILKLPTLCLLQRRRG